MNRNHSIIGLRPTDATLPHHAERSNPEKGAFIAYTAQGTINNQDENLIF